MQTEESAVDSLHAEVNFYRRNHLILEEEIRTLIEDNKKLSHQSEALLKERAELATRSAEHGRSNQDDLQNQISLLTKERDSLIQLWQTSQRTIEALETELKTYQNEYYSHNHNIQQNTRSNVRNRNDTELKFTTALEEITALEKKLEEAATRENNISKELKDKEEEIKKYQEKEKTLEDSIRNIQHNVDEYKRNLDNERKINEDLVKRLDGNKNELELSSKREIEAKSKVSEALNLLDLVTAQRDDACIKAITASEELVCLKSTINEVTADIETRLRTELDDVKEKYDEKISDMLTHVQTLDAELVEKGLLLAKTLRENKVLKKANGSLEKLQADSISSVDPRLAIADQKLEAAFQELVLSERRNIRLVSEKQSLALDSQRQRDAHARDIKRRDWENAILRTEITDHKLQIEHLQKSLDETDAMVNKLQTLLSSKSDLNHRMVSCKEEEVTALNEHVQKQIDLNKKWRQSYMDMTEKLKKRLDDLYEENKRLKSQKNSIKYVENQMLDLDVLAAS